MSLHSQYSLAAQNKQGSLKDKHAQETKILLWETQTRKNLAIFSQKKSIQFKYNTNHEDNP